MAVPIWKDYYVELTDTSSDYSDGCQYRIRTGNTILYEGLAFPIPGDDAIGVYINDICADSFFRQGLSNILYREFIVERMDADTETWEEVDDIYFRPDWSWDEKFAPGNGCNFPINGVLHPLQRVPFSFANRASGSVLIHNTRQTGSFSMDFNFDFQVQTETSQEITFTGNTQGHEHWLMLTSYPYADYLECQGQRYTIKPMCGGVVLYYINAYGYWDSFVPEGRAKVADTLVRHTRGVNSINGPGVATRGRENYANEITRKVTFRTGPLTTEQSSRMHHLLNSPYVLMYDTERGEWWPISLTGNNNTYQNQAGSLHFYDIEAELAQDMIRR